MTPGILSARLRSCRIRYAFRSHSWTHPEGWRDWPNETPPTCSRSHAGKKVAIPSGSNRESLGDAVGDLPVHLPKASAAQPGGGFISMPADALKCKECQTTYAL